MFLWQYLLINQNKKERLPESKHLKHKIKNFESKRNGVTNEQRFMKIITWNCNMAFRKKWSLLLAYNPDL